MATSGNRDVRLGVEIETIGEDSLKRMADDVRRLAKEGGDAAPEFAALAAQLDKLAAQAAALEQFKTLATEVEALTAAQRAAATAAADLGARLEAQQAKTAEATKVQRAAAAAVGEAKDAINEQKRAIESLDAETDAAGKKLASYVAQQRADAVELVKRKTALDEATTAQRAANVAAKDAADAERPLTKEYDAAAAAATRATKALQDRAAALRAAESATVAAGASTTDLAQAEAALLAEKVRLDAEIGDVGVRVMREQAESDRLAIIQRVAYIEAVERGQQALAAELTTIREAEEFTRNFAAAQKAAAADALKFVEAEDAAAAAADKAARRMAELNAQAEKTARDAAYVDAFTAALNDVDAKARAATLATERLSAQAATLKDAFGQTGVRSMQAIVDEMQRVGSSLTTLKQQYNAGAISAADLDRATSSAAVRIATLRTELQTIPALPNVFEKINSGIQDAISRFGALSAAIAVFGFALRPVIEADVAFENLRRTLTFVTGSAATANQQIAFLRETANKAGLSAGELTDSFSLFEASLLKSGLSLQTTQTLFAGVGAAAGKLGITTDRTGNILLALGQIANKGKVALEELQGQIGEALPGALKLSADSLGITTAQLTKLLQNGRLLAEDFLPAFGKALVKTFGEGEKPVEGLAQSFNRLKTAATTVATQLVDTGPYRALVSVLDSLAANFGGVVTGAASVVKGFLAIKAIDMAREFFGVKAAAELAAAAKLTDAAAAETQAKATRDAAVAAEEGAVALGNNTRAMVANTAAAETAAVAQRTFAGGAMAAVEAGFTRTAGAVVNATTKIGSFVTSLGGPYGLALGVAITFSEQLGNALANVAARATGAAQALEKNEAKLRALADADKARAEAAQRAADDLAASFVKTQAAYDLDITAADRRIKISDKLVKAKREEGVAAVALAGLTGEEVKVLDAQAKASGAVAAAMGAETKARQAEINLLENERAALVKAAGAEETWTAARRQSFVDFDANLDKKKADLEVSKQQAAAESAAADSAFLAAQKYRDNAKDLESLKIKVADATATYNKLVELYKAGLVPAALVSEAAKDLAFWQGKLKDSYNDSTLAIQRQQQALREQTTLQQQDNTLQRTRINNQIQISDLTGQYVNKLQASIDLKAIDVTESTQKIAADTQDAKLLRERAQLLQEQLKLGDPLYDQKKREIDSTINAAKEKEKEGLIERENLDKLNIELGILDGTLYQSVKGFGDQAAAADKASHSLLDYSAAAVKARNAAVSASSIAKPDPRSPKALGTGDSVLAPTGSLGLNKDGTNAGGYLPLITLPSGERIPLDPSQRTANGSGIGNAFGGGELVVTDAQARAIALDELRRQGLDTSALTAAGTAPASTPDKEQLLSGGRYEISFNLGNQRYTTYSNDKDTAEGLVRALEDAFKLALGG